MAILGIETSCDETGVAVYGRAGLLAQRLSSQIQLHAEHGGVVPELASRDHVAKLAPLTRLVLADAGLTPSDLDAVAYTAGPGLVGALMVGASVAAGLGYGLQLPVIALHHMEAHLLAPQMESDGPDFPFVALLVSGGHSMLVDVAGVGRYRILGQTRDDAAGEAFDKVARLLGLPYPGGPAIAALAERGDPSRIAFPRPLSKKASLDFSFSGLKTAVRLAVERAGTLSDAHRADIAASFQEAVVDSLADKSCLALKATARRRLVLAGGVAANKNLRQRMEREASAGDFRIYSPPPALCTDNGAMVAYAGWCRRADGHSGIPRVLARPRWSLEDLRPPGHLEEQHG